LDSTSTGLPKPNALEKMALIAAIAVIAWLMARPLWVADSSYFYFDDFFYYLVPARHFLSTGSFFFYPGIATNGFQPLWMAVITGLLALSASHMAVFFVLLNAAIALLFLVTLCQAMALLREQGASPVMRLATGLFAAAMDMEIATTGMEVALALPLLLWVTRLVLRRPFSARNERQLVGIGFLGSMVVLARLDAALLLLPVAVMLLHDRLALRQIMALGFGALPLVFYALANKLLTGNWLPISGQAKLLKDNLVPGLRPLTGFFEAQGGMAVIFFISYFGLAVLALLAKCPAGKERERRLLHGCFLGTLLYYVAYCTLSDWQVWFWYMYPLAWLGVMALVILSQQKNRFIECGLMALAALLLVPSVMTIASRTPDNNPIYQRALALAAFAKTHPGNYAMGDCAGIAGYFMDSSVLQLEGLMGDASFLDNIRNRVPLSSVLKNYKSDYYVATDAHENKGCYDFREPALAGAHSPAMTGHSCAAPLMRYDSGGTIMVFRAGDVRG
jgi:hypothetical protein